MVTRVTLSLLSMHPFNNSSTFICKILWDTLDDGLFIVILISIEEREKLNTTES